MEVCVCVSLALSNIKLIRPRCNAGKDLKLIIPNKFFLELLSLSDLVRPHLTFLWRFLQIIKFASRVNCRNPWFREFWRKHHRCEFGERLASTGLACNRLENITRYQQEGLVPFVSKSLRTANNPITGYFQLLNKILFSVES